MNHPMFCTADHTNELHRSAPRPVSGTDLTVLVFGDHRQVHVAIMTAGRVVWEGNLDGAELLGVALVRAAQEGSSTAAA